MQSIFRHSPKTIQRSNKLLKTSPRYLKFSCCVDVRPFSASTHRPQDRHDHDIPPVDQTLISLDEKETDNEQPESNPSKLHSETHRKRYLPRYWANDEESVTSLCQTDPEFKEWVDSQRSRNVRDMKQLFRRITQPVAIITALSEKAWPNSESQIDDRSRFRAMTISSLTTVTMDPVPFISFNVRLPSSTFDALSKPDDPRFKIHILGIGDQHQILAKSFAEGDPLEALETLSALHELEIRGEAGSPADLVPKDEKRPHVLYCRLDRTIPVGDHVIVVAQVLHIQDPYVKSLSKPALLHYKNGSFSYGGQALQYPDLHLASGKSGDMHRRITDRITKYCSDPQNESKLKGAGLLEIMRAVKIDPDTFSAQDLDRIRYTLKNGIYGKLFNTPEAGARDASAFRDLKTVLANIENRLTPLSASPLDPASLRYKMLQSPVDLGNWLRHEGLLSKDMSDKDLEKLYRMALTSQKLRREQLLPLAHAEAISDIQKQLRILARTDMIPRAALKRLKAHEHYTAIIDVLAAPELERTLRTLSMLPDPLSGADTKAMQEICEAHNPTQIARRVTPRVVQDIRHISSSFHGRPPAQPAPVLVDTGAVTGAFSFDEDEAPGKATFEQQRAKTVEDLPMAMQRHVAKIIQFCRYEPDIARQGPRAVLEALELPVEWAGEIEWLTKPEVTHVSSRGWEAARNEGDLGSLGDDARGMGLESLDEAREEGLASDGASRESLGSFDEAQDEALSSDDTPKDRSKPPDDAPDKKPLSFDEDSDDIPTPRKS